MMRPLADRLREHLGLAEPTPVPFDRGPVEWHDRHGRAAVQYRGREGDLIPAWLFLPRDPDAERAAAAMGGVVVFHQHAGQFHLGKSEVAGDAGETLQAFGPALARRGFAVLAPDALTFEDRRTGTAGTEPHDGDWLQHYNALAYRLVQGQSLMRKGLDDAQCAFSVLLDQEEVAGRACGVVGHSFGGLVAMYHAAVDGRVAWAVVSGAVSSFAERMERGTGINMFEVEPGLRGVLETADLVAAIGPRPLFVVSGTEDPYAVDADRVVEGAQPNGHVTSLRVPGGHALDAGRHDAIVEWVTDRVRAPGADLHDSKR